MSDKGTVSGRVSRKKKVGKGSAMQLQKISFDLVSQRVPGEKKKNWNQLWPEFFERLKTLCKHYRITVKRVKSARRS